MQRLASSKKLFAALLSVIFCLMLVLNFLTRKCVDDYAYMFSFADSSRITSVLQIFPSIRAHALNMNGRLAAHFMVQLFNLLPKAIFNFINAGMFVLLIGLSYRFAAGKEIDCFLLLFLFCSVWFFEPDFGQVNLWLTGSCNYLWGLVFNLLFIVPFYRFYNSGKGFEKQISAVLFVVYSFFSGAYLEAASASAIFIGFLFLLLVFLRKERIPFYFFFSLAAAFAGFLTMVFAPAESIKTAESAAGLSERISRVLSVYLKFWPLLVLFVLFFVLSHRLSMARNHRGSALVFLAGSLFANFLFLFGSSYSGRCASAALLLLIIADAILFHEFISSKAFAVPYAAALLLVPFTAYSMLFGVYDVYNTGKLMRLNENTILQCKAAGEPDILLPNISGATKYSAVYGLKYLDGDRSDTWPNESIASYFEVSSVSTEW